MNNKEYLYSWGHGNGYCQTIENGKVIAVISITVEEAQREYYKTRSPEMQAFDTKQEDIAKRSNQYWRSEDAKES